MGIRDEIQDELEQAFDDELEDVVVHFKIISDSLVSGYDIESGTREYIKEIDETRGIFSVFSDKKIDGIKILQTDEKVLINAKEISVVPKEGDVIITIGKNIRYNIISATPLMGGGSTPITYSLQVRK